MSGDEKSISSADQSSQTEPPDPFSVQNILSSSDVNALGQPKKVANLIGQLGLIPHPEGGFFLESFRSGSQPMSSRGQTDLDVEAHCLVETTARELCRPDKKTQRNCLTSIYWVPTLKSPRLPLTANLSDHVHYYQGGLPFQYYIYNPKTASLRSTVLGPNMLGGQMLQISVVSGEWKCGVLLEADLIEADYCIIGEAVGPGFDFHDFHWVTAKELSDSKPSKDVFDMLRNFLHQSETAKNEEFDSHYDDDETKQIRVMNRK
jgi:predicted cupin superfamily sugar epimerase